MRNDSAEKIRFQIGVFAWDQNPKGEMVLNPTEDLIFYPALLALEPGMNAEYGSAPTIRWLRQKSRIGFLSKSFRPSKTRNPMAFAS